MYVCVCVCVCVQRRVREVQTALIPTEWNVMRGGGLFNSQR